jgi:hypothetical protein
MARQLERGGCARLERNDARLWIYGWPIWAQAARALAVGLTGDFGPKVGLHEETAGIRRRYQTSASRRRVTPLLIVGINLVGIDVGRSPWPLPVAARI